MGDEARGGGQMNARIGYHSDPELPCDHCNNQFKFTVSRRQNTHLLPRSSLGDPSRCLRALSGAAGMMRSLVTSRPVWEAHSPRNVMAWTAELSPFHGQFFLLKSKKYFQCITLKIDLEDFVTKHLAYLEKGFVISELAGPGVIPGFFVLGIWRQGWTT